MSSEELRDLFTLHEDCPSHLYEKIKDEGEEGEEGEAEDAAAPREDKPQEGWPKETGDMHLWGHHHGCEGVNDVVRRTPCPRRRDSPAAPP